MFDSTTHVEVTSSLKKICSKWSWSQNWGPSFDFPAVFLENKKNICDEDAKSFNLKTFFETFFTLNRCFVKVDAEEAKKGNAMGKDGTKFTQNIEVKMPFWNT